MKRIRDNRYMEYIIWFVTMIPCSMVMTGIGIYAWKRKKPMWFWSGTTVDESEITDVAAYNRANGIMWITFSLIFWISTFAGALKLWKTMKIAVITSGSIVTPSSIRGREFTSIRWSHNLHLM